MLLVNGFITGISYIYMRTFFHENELVPVISQEISLTGDNIYIGWGIQRQQYTILSKLTTCTIKNIIKYIQWNLTNPTSFG